MTVSAPAAVVCGVGTCLPPLSLTNDDVIREGRLDSSDAWIRTRTGIARRHRATGGVTTGDLATAAGAAAVDSANRTAPGPPPDLVVLATTTPDRSCPATAPDVAHRLGLSGVPAVDVAAVCSGFVYALVLAAAAVSSGAYARPLVIAGETYSTIVDPGDRETAVIFGDGAGAVLLRRGTRADHGAVLATDLGSDGSGRDLVTVAGPAVPPGDAPAGTPAERPYFRMRGREVYRHAVRHMCESSHAVLARAGWSPDSVRAFVGHQANQRILDAVAQRLGIDQSHRFGNIREVGNTAAASIPLALASALRRGAAEPGDRTLLTAFGGGLTWGSIAMTWPDAVPLARPPAARTHTRERTDPWTNPLNA